MDIRLTQLNYIALYYPILNEIVECDYVSFLRGFFSFFPSIVNLHSPGDDGRPIRESEREGKEKERQRIKKPR